MLPSTLSKTASLLKSVCKDELKATRNKATPLNRTGQKWKPTRCPLILLFEKERKTDDKCCPSPFLDATNSFDCEFRILLITLCYASVNFARSTDDDSWG